MSTMCIYIDDVLIIRGASTSKGDAKETSDEKKTETKKSEKKEGVRCEPLSFCLCNVLLFWCCCE